MSVRRDHVSTGDLLREPHLAPLGLALIAGENGVGRRITNARLQKPGLALAGHLPYVKEGRVEVIGASECEFLVTLQPAIAAERAEAVVKLEPPLIVVTKGLREAAALFMDPCQRHGVPLILTDATTSTVIERFSEALEFLLSTREVRHGDLLDIFAIGVLLQGDSGSGKSECALELVHRGHRLVADDVVEIHRMRHEELIGRAPAEIRGLMEVRGLGLISIEQLFGSVAVRDSKPIDLVVNLVPDKTLLIERLGLAESTEEILGLARPALTILVAPGRSLALLIECAARKHLLTQRGVPDAAKEYLLRHDRNLAGP